MSDRKLVHIVDDEEAIRRSASFMLKTSGYAVETWANGVAFLKEIRHVSEGCILLDVRMPEMDGLEVQQALLERGVTMPVIMLTGHADVSIAVRTMKAGAVDFLEKPFEKAVLIASIEAAFARMEAAEGAAARSAEAEVVLGILTPREREVLEGLAQGLPNKTIAYDLGISPRTVEVHRANLMAKLEVRSLSDALRLAFAAGLGA
ncbi:MULTISPECIES: response regulator [unclassified Sphingopyxis]|uniref:response regulator transcription factor n=1 Tax=unclassified Sphingopyxis TaxID=2614943 RepID=UPI00073186BE|nr:MULTISPECIES: response regulator [unclassified Sphingopyxis]KTE27923.1 two-component system response regulator [Sphingopyxis sp. H057]KTE55902.1 two-component system response regulator [Sphingopyxis sp. H073]KTE57422.1 two-component system response regulator [Sphingopyxis sp. H071]KTE61626.1 two-component system response regulator [Sphingopyxis sp. H107]KTE65161.1 two-component system response regulator [Sphingopyxis sp. H100]